MERHILKNIKSESEEEKTMTKKIKRWGDEFVNGKEYIEFINNKGEKILIEIYRTHADKKDKNDVMSYFVKNGKIPRFIENRLTVQTYATLTDGSCYGWYNPTHKLHESGARCVLDFDWMLEDTAENRARLVFIRIWARHWESIYKSMAQEQGKRTFKICLLLH